MLKTQQHKALFTHLKFGLHNILTTNIEVMIKIITMFLLLPLY